MREDYVICGAKLPMRCYVIQSRIRYIVLKSLSAKEYRQTQRNNNFQLDEYT